MKLSRNLFKRLIKEEVNRLLSENSDRMMSSLKSALKGTGIGFEQVGEDELYIMTGEAEGITVKLTHRGRPKSHEDNLKGAIEDLRKRAEDRRGRAEKEDDTDMVKMYNQDAGDLDSIADATEDAIEAEQPAGKELQTMVAELDTAVRDDIPDEIYYWVFPNSGG